MRTARNEKARDVIDVVFDGLRGVENENLDTSLRCLFVDVGLVILVQSLKETHRNQILTLAIPLVASLFAEGGTRFQIDDTRGGYDLLHILQPHAVELEFERR